MIRAILLFALAASAAFAQCAFTISPTSASAPAAGGTGTIVITGPAGCQRTASSNTPSWITVTFGQTGTGNGTAGWAADRNTYPVSRTGTITVAGQTLTVTQAAAVCDFNLVPVSAAFDGAGGKGAFTVKTTCSYTPAPTNDWIAIDTVTPNGEVHFTVAPNPLSTPRTGGIRIGDAVFSITQSGPCLALSAPGSRIMYQGGNYSFDISAPPGCKWTAAPTVSWIGIDPASGDGGATVRYTVMNNDGTSERSGAIRVNDLAYSITQAARPGCTYVLNPPGGFLPAEAVTAHASVGTDVRCGWTPTTRDAWILIQDPARVRMGPGEFTYAVTANTAAAPRSGTISILGQNFTVTQNAAGVQMELAALTNAASYGQGAVAPGEIVTIFGKGLGPANLATLQLTPDGTAITSSLAGTRVLFDGIPAPVVYTSATQVSAIVPYAVEGKSAVEVRVEYQGNSAAAQRFNVLPSAPGIFALDASGTGPGAILNQDYSVNTAANAAPRGSVVMVYATGGGQTDPPSTDGSIALADAQLRLPVTARIGGAAARVLYAGAAPSLVSGVIQVNVEVPAEAPAGAQQVAIRIGDFETRAPVTVAIRQ